MNVYKVYRNNFFIDDILKYYKSTSLWDYEITIILIKKLDNLVINYI